METEYAAVRFEARGHQWSGGAGVIFRRRHDANTASPQSARVPSLVTWARVSLVTRHMGPCLPCDMFPRGFPHVPNVAVDT